MGPWDQDQTHSVLVFLSFSFHYQMLKTLSANTIMYQATHRTLEEHQAQSREVTGMKHSLNAACRDLYLVSKGNSVPSYLPHYMVTACKP